MSTPTTVHRICEAAAIVYGIEKKRMSLLTKKETKILLSRLYWDVDVDPEHLYQLLTGEKDRIEHIDIHNLYYRILTTLNWYDILNIIAPEKLGELLSDSVLDKIRFKDLKEKYLYARKQILQ